MKNSIFWDITPHKSVEVNRHFGGTYRLHLQGWRVNQATITLFACFVLFSCLAYSSNLMMEAICFSGISTLVEFQRPTRCYIPEDRDLHTTAVRTVNSFECDTLFIRLWLTSNAQIRSLYPSFGRSFKGLRERGRKYSRRVSERETSWEKWDTLLWREIKSKVLLEGSALPFFW
jgi:hypothetical protein